MNTDNNAPTANAGETETTQTLESIAKEIPVEVEARAFTATPPPSYQTAQAATPPAPYIPDPITDQDGYRRWVSSQMSTTERLHGTLQDVVGKIKSYEEQQKQAQTDREVNDVISKVNSNLNLDPDLVEASLNVMYKKDPAFKRIWDNRQRHPQALENALKVITNEMKGKYAVRQDPQIAENIRAAKQSQQSLATRQPENNDAIKMDQRNFQQYWQRLIHGG